MSTGPSSPSDGSMELAGQVLGGFRLIERVGAGGMGEVWRAENAKVSRMVRAVKVIRPELAAVPEFRDRFLLEAEYLDRLQHPNILRVENIGEDNGVLFMVMEFLSGQSADQLVGQLSVEETCRVVHDAALGLAHAHRNEIVHRDLKPANLFITHAGEVRVLDFGIARHGTASGVTVTGRMQPGTPAYYAPELAGGKAASPASDVYALMVTLFELLAGRTPFVPDAGVTGSQAMLFYMHQHTSTPMPDVRELRPEVPDELQAVIADGTVKDPSRRLPDAGAVAERLAAFAAAAPAPSDSALTPSGTSSPAMSQPGPAVAGFPRSRSSAGVPAIVPQRRASLNQMPAARSDDEREPSVGGVRGSSGVRPAVTVGRGSPRGRAAPGADTTQPQGGAAAPKRLIDQLADAELGTADTAEATIGNSRPKRARADTDPNRTSSDPLAADPESLAALAARPRRTLLAVAAAAVVLTGAFALHAMAPEDPESPRFAAPPATPLAPSHAEVAHDSPSAPRVDVAHGSPSASPPAPAPAPLPGPSRPVKGSGSHAHGPREPSPPSAGELADAPTEGCNTPADCIDACDVHHRAAACLTVAALYTVGTSRQPANSILAANFFQKACALGSAEGCKSASGSAAGNPTPSPTHSGRSDCVPQCARAGNDCRDSAQRASAQCASGCNVLSGDGSCVSNCIAQGQRDNAECASAEKDCRHACGS